MYLSVPPESVWRMPTRIPVPPPPPPNTPFAQFHGFVMDSRTPVVLVLCYATAVHACNRIRRSNRKSLPFCNTSAFHFAVLLHNVGLCLYSAWTFVGISVVILKSLRTTFLVTNGQLGLVGTFWTALCDSSSGLFPQGLAYYGYLFYLSKFYEIVDTVIILCKGRPSSLLQTYHHSGALLCMWASMRYRTPPVWVFVGFNSLIHAIMYFYYTCSALKIQVPQIFKSGLTTIQIFQFLFGSLLALCHAFVYYTKVPSGDAESTINTTSASSSPSACACVDDAGKFWALLLNLTYLAPLTYLFICFWIQSTGQQRRRVRQKALDSTPTPTPTRKAPAHAPEPKSSPESVCK